MTDYQPLRQADIDRMLEGVSEEGRNQLAARAIQYTLIKGLPGATGVLRALGRTANHYIKIRIAKRRHRAVSGEEAA